MTWSFLMTSKRHLVIGLHFPNLIFQRQLVIGISYHPMLNNYSHGIFLKLELSPYMCHWFRTAILFTTSVIFAQKYQFSLNLIHYNRNSVKRQTILVTECNEDIFQKSPLKGNGLGQFTNVEIPFSLNG